MSWAPYDPTWLVELARDQAPEHTWLPDALAACTQCCCGTTAYLYFVDPSNPNQPGAAWQFKENIILEHPIEGDLILDVLEGYRIGGIEFLSRV